MRYSDGPPDAQQRVPTKAGLSPRREGPAAAGPQARQGKGRLLSYA